MNRLSIFLKKVFSTKLEVSDHSSTSNFAASSELYAHRTLSDNSASAELRSLDQSPLGSANTNPTDVSLKPFLDKKNKTESKWNRREIFSASTLFASSLLTACAPDAAFSGKTTLLKRNKGEDGTGGDPTDPLIIEPPLKPPPPPPAVICKNQTDEAKEKITSPLTKDLPAGLNSTIELKVKFYGSKSSALLAVGLKELVVDGESLSSFSVYDEDNHPIVQYRIQYDYPAKQFCFDNLFITGSKIVVMLELNSGKKFKKSFNVSFTDSIVARGNTLKELSPSSGGFGPGTQAVANFDRVSYIRTSFEVDGGRVIKISGSNSTFKPADRLDGFDVYDMLGNQLSTVSNQQNYLDPLKYTCFVAYKTDGTTTYRTIIRMT